MKLEGVQIQKDFLVYHFWAACSYSHLERQLLASISDCLTALTRALRASLRFSLSSSLDWGSEHHLQMGEEVRKGSGCCFEEGDYEWRGCQVMMCSLLRCLLSTHGQVKSIFLQQYCPLAHFSASPHPDTELSCSLSLPSVGLIKPISLASSPALNHKWPDKSQEQCYASAHHLLKALVLSHRMFQTKSHQHLPLLPFTPETSQMKQHLLFHTGSWSPSKWAVLHSSPPMLYSGAWCLSMFPGVRVRKAQYGLKPHSLLWIGSPQCPS